MIRSMPFSAQLVFFIVLMIVPLVSNAGSASANNCEATRVDGPNGSLARVPVYNQMKFTKEDSNICWAIAAAELADAYRAQQGVRFSGNVSPISIALEQKSQSENRYLKSFSDPEITYSEPFKKPDLSTAGKIETTALWGTVVGSEIDDGLRSINGKLVCNQQYLNKRVDLEGDEDQASSTRYLRGKTDSIHDYFYSVLTAVQEKREALAVSELKERISHQLTARRACPSKLFSDLDKISAALTAAIETDPYADFVATDVLAFTNRLCRSNSIDVKIPDPVTIHFVPHWTEPADKDAPGKALDAIEKNLKRGQPTGIALAPCILRGAKACEIIAGDQNVGHAMIIAGQRPNPQNHHCEFLVRNSYGSRCLNERNEQAYGWPCENGSLWVDSETLLKHTSSVTWIP